MISFNQSVSSNWSTWLPLTSSYGKRLMFQRLWVQIPAREMFEKAENKWKRKRGIVHYWRRKNIFKNVEIDWICYRLFPSKQEFIAQLRWPTTRSQSYKETSLQDWAQIWTAYLTGTKATYHCADHALTAFFYFSKSPFDSADVLMCFADSWKRV